MQMQTRCRPSDGDQFTKKYKNRRLKDVKADTGQNQVSVREDANESKKEHRLNPKSKIQETVGNKTLGRVRTTLYRVT